MNKRDFLKEAEDFIYKEIAKNANLLLGKNKTAALSTGLFLKLPIEVTLTKSDQPLPKLYKELETFMPYFSAYTKVGDTTKVYFTFLYHTESDLKSLRSNIERRSVFLTFVYIHELQHIIRKHITTSYNTMMLRIADGIQDPHQAINIAEDYAINYSIKDLFIISPLSSHWNEIEKIGMYNSKYHEDQMSDIDILKDMKANAKPMKCSNIAPGLSKVEYDDKSSIQPTDGKGEGPGEETTEGKSKTDKCSTHQDDLDTSLSDLSESIQDIIRTNTKGSGAGELFEKMFDSIKVETGWFKKIKASFKRQVFYKTHDYNTSWANLNNTYRRIYKSPKKFFMDDKIKIILSVDHSGSMANEDLQKLLYLIESEATKISSVQVLIHDYTVTKVFDVENEYDITKATGFKEALATRYSAGGTSHDCVFQHIQDLKLEDPSKVIYLCFSDMYSDIESVVKTYPIMRRLTNYWVSPVANNVSNTVPGTKIQMC